MGINSQKWPMWVGQIILMDRLYHIITCMEPPVCFCFLNDEFSAISGKYIVDEEQCWVGDKATVLKFLGRTRDRVN